jgi:hypothetical protein
LEFYGCAGLEARRNVALSTVRRASGFPFLVFCGFPPMPIAALRLASLSRADRSRKRSVSDVQADDANSGAPVPDGMSTWAALTATLTAVVVFARKRSAAT